MNNPIAFVKIFRNPSEYRNRSGFDEFRSITEIRQHTEFNAESPAINSKYDRESGYYAESNDK
jgi:predicted nucleotidyltransferase